MSTDRFIIVVEVDNKRALAAFRKGLEELNVIWPLVMERARKIDADRSENYRRRLERFEVHKTKLDAIYEENMKAWNSRTLFSRGLTMPPPPPPICRLSDPEPLNENAHYWDSVRKNLEHMVNVAGAATAPYRMTEWQVEKMIAWEDGSEIAQITGWANGRNEAFTFLYGGAA